MSLLSEQFQTLKLFFREFEPKLSSRLRHGYSWELFQKDVIAGLTVASIAFPLSMALAVAAGAPPQQGLITSIIGGLVVAFLGGSRTQIAGPTGAFVVVIYTVMATHGTDGLVMATLMAGALLILAGFARLGAIVKYVPYSVITGFTTGLALVLLTAQIKDFFALPIDGPTLTFLDTWQQYLQHIYQLDLTTTLISITCLVYIIYLRKRVPRMPILFSCIIISSLIVWGFNLNLATIGSRYGALPDHISLITMPAWSLEKMVAVFPAALTIAFLAGIESLLCAVLADGMTGDRHRSNMELVAQGIANILSPLFGGAPVTATFSRTAINIKAGAQTPISGIVHSLAVFAGMTLFSQVVMYVPLATLAAICVALAWDMSALHKFFRLLRVADSERIVLVLTFVLTVMSNLTVAIQAGIIVSSFFFVQRMGRLTHITPDEDHRETPDLPDSVCVYHVHGPFFFGAASRIKSVLDKHSRDARTIYILNLEDMPLIDATGVHVLSHFVEKCHKRNAVVILSGMNPQPLHTLKRMGADNIVAAKHQTKTLEHAIRLSREILQLTEPVLTTQISLPTRADEAAADSKPH